jgi:hypothetical protein
MARFSFSSALGLAAAAVLFSACTAGAHVSATGAAGSSGSPLGSAGVGSGSGGQGGGPSNLLGVSGSSGTTDGGGATSGDAKNCGLQYFDPNPKPADVLLLLDRSGSMQDPPEGSASGTPPKWTLVTDAVKSVVTSSDGLIHWGLKTFPEGTGSECAAGSVTNKVDVAIAANNAAAVVNAVNNTVDDGNGTPTGDAVNYAMMYLQGLNDGNQHYILLATDGEPSCAGTSSNSTDARTFAVQEVATAATNGIKTFVVGVATTKTSDTTTLNQLADAGKEPRNDTRPGATHFYLGSTEADLATALGVITGRVSCTFPLSATPPVPDKVGVYFGTGMSKVPRDTTQSNGWDYTDSSQTSVQVFGAWCDMITAAGSNSVQIIFGCASIDIP